MIEFTMLHPGYSVKSLGLIPEFLFAADPRPAKEQFNQWYAHGGGWRPMMGWTITNENDIVYGEDMYSPIAEAKLRKEHILIYDHAWVAIVQPDRSFEVSRMD